MQQIVKAKDGKWMTVSMGKRDQFERFVRDVLASPDILNLSGAKKYPRVTGTASDGIEVRDAYQRVIETRDREAWLQRCFEFNVPAAPHATANEIGDPGNTVGAHMRANNYIREEEHRDYGRYTVVGQPATFSAYPNEPVQGSWHAPDLGEHTVEMLERLKFSTDEIKALHQNTGAVPPARGPYVVERASPTSPRKKTSQPTE